MAVHRRLLVVPVDARLRPDRPLAGHVHLLLAESTASPHPTTPHHTPPHPTLIRHGSRARRTDTPTRKGGGLLYLSNMLGNESAQREPNMPSSKRSQNMPAQKEQYIFRNASRAGLTVLAHRPPLTNPCRGSGGHSPTRLTTPPTSTCRTRSSHWATLTAPAPLQHLSS